MSSLLKILKQIKISNLSKLHVSKESNYSQNLLSQSACEYMDSVVTIYIFFCGYMELWMQYDRINE